MHTVPYCLQASQIKQTRALFLHYWPHCYRQATKGHQMQTSANKRMNEDLALFVVI